MKNFIRIVLAITLTTTLSSAIAQYRFSYSLHGSMPQLAHPGGDNNETPETPDVPEASDGRYRCDATNYEGSIFSGQCSDGTYLGSDASGNPLKGTCSQGSYNFHVTYDPTTTYSGQCQVLEDFGSENQQKTFACEALDKDFNPTSVMCKEGALTGEDINGNAITGYCRDMGTYATYTMTDKDFNIVSGICNQ